MAAGKPHPTDLLWADPAAVMTRAGLTPDPWQREVLASNRQRVLLCCSRQAGKSQTAAAVALLTALREPGALILLLSPVQRQSKELLQAKLMPLYRRGGFRAYSRPTQESALSMELANGSRIISLPGKPDTIVGFSNVSLLVIDEASRVADELYYLVRPMLATSKGRLLALSTPKGKRGWFYEQWAGLDTAEDGQTNPWQRFEITADRCPRIDAEFLREERLTMGENWFRQEYYCGFNDSIDAVFADADIQASVIPALAPLEF